MVGRRDYSKFYLTRSGAGNRYRGFPQQTLITSAYILKLIIYATESTLSRLEQIENRPREFLPECYARNSKRPARNRCSIFLICRLLSKDQLAVVFHFRIPLNTP